MDNREAGQRKLTPEEAGGRFGVYLALAIFLGPLVFVILERLIR